ncbi:conserved hypothetical protein (plasmid) [Borreliella valaisiana VS116]|uniref:Uncharacterized protein n=1 Tax=Borreliella valaisiana VS116 TaxID=445987 RepID=C0R8Y7_BORVA|nr:conserved hypothetical protein [Borreliella valaisiana VS116]
MINYASKIFCNFYLKNLVISDRTPVVMIDIAMGTTTIAEIVIILLLTFSFSDNNLLLVFIFFNNN